jgi:hypothetical protein
MQSKNFIWRFSPKNPIEVNPSHYNTKQENIDDSVDISRVWKILERIEKYQPQTVQVIMN